MFGYDMNSFDTESYDNPHRDQKSHMFMNFKTWQQIYNNKSTEPPMTDHIVSRVYNLEKCDKVEALIDFKNCRGLSLSEQNMADEAVVEFDYIIENGI